MQRRIVFRNAQPDKFTLKHEVKKFLPHPGNRTSWDTPKLWDSRHAKTFTKLSVQLLSAVDTKGPKIRVLFRFSFVFQHWDVTPILILPLVLSSQSESPSIRFFLSFFNGWSLELPSVKRINSETPEVQLSKTSSCFLSPPIPLFIYFFWLYTLTSRNSASWTSPNFWR